MIAARALLVTGVVTCVAAVPGAARPSTRSGRPSVVAYENGRWFTGSSFVARTMYVAQGRFVERPARVGSVVDLHGGHVVPPFGEAHNHNLEATDRLDQVVRDYVHAGVFYVQNPNALPETREAVTEALGERAVLEATFTSGGLTGPGGHPVEIADRNIARGRWSAKDGEGGFLFSIPDAAGLEHAWPRLLAARPDFVKLYLLYSEEYATRLADPKTVGWRGLDPALVPDIVRRGHASRRRVVAHVETAADFHVAVAAGVDVIAHVPGFRGDEGATLPDVGRYQVPEADARQAGARRIVVVTTLAGFARSADRGGDKALRAAIDGLNRDNLARLRRHSVPIAVGSDEYRETSVDEARYLRELGVFEPAELLRVWCEATPRAIFPKRPIGRLQPGYEASFLVLEGDPLVDFENVTRIRARVKQGRTLEE
jgi:imidazolonepropionase-like amidohydrolase